MALRRRSGGFHRLISAGKGAKFLDGKPLGPLFRAQARRLDQRGRIEAQGFQAGVARYQGSLDGEAVLHKVRPKVSIHRAQAGPLVQALDERLSELTFKVVPGIRVS